MKRPQPLTWALRCALLSSAAFLVLNLQAQRVKHWVGGSGTWSDEAHWSLTPGGAGGAGSPHSGESASVIAPNAMELTIDRDVTCASLVMDATHGSILFTGSVRNTLRVEGDLRLSGDLDWQYGGPLELNRREGSAGIDAHTVIIASDLVIDGGAQWELTSSLLLADNATLTLRGGTLRTNDRVMQVGTLRAEGRATKRFEAGGSIILLKSFEPAGFRSVVDPGSSTLMVDGLPMRWDGSHIDLEEFERAATTCGTGVGQTPFTVNATVTTNYNGFGVTCDGACDGAVTVTITGGIGPFARQWSGGPTTDNWGPICAGNKLVLVTDLGQSLGCFASVVVTTPPPLGVFFFGLNPPTCADVCNGTATTFPGGGTGFGYVYDWNNGVESNSSPSQLCAGVNTLQLVDANNCVFDTSFTIDLLPISAVLTFTGALCSGECNGTAHVAVSGGTPGYTYQWNPGTPQGDGTPDVTGLCAGNYSVLVADVNGCDTTIAFTITEPAPIVPGLTFTDAACFNSCDGTASAAPSGAVGPYSFNWAPDPITGDGTANITGLCAGNYTVLITDQASGCDTLVSFIIGSAPAIDVQLTTTDATCSNGCDGTADITVSGGTPGFIILWAPGIITGQGTGSASQLCPGDYTVTVTDAAGCDTTLQFTIGAPPPILPNETFTDVTCFGACDGTITTAPTGGTGPFTYNWVPAPIVGQGTPAASVLCAGDWSVTITDSLGCDTTVTVTITEPPQLVLASSQTNISCGNLCDGTATVVATGGTPPYTYNWSGSPSGQGTPSVTGLCVGAYTVVVTDSALCQRTQLFFIQQPPPLVVDVVTVDATCPDFCNGTASAAVSGGNDPYTYAWSPAPGGGQNTPNVTGLCASDYTLTVTDSVGCDTAITVTISAPLPIDPQATVVNATCFGVCDGSIVLNPSGGFGSFTYTWNPSPPNGQGTAQALGLCAGMWSVTVASGVCDTVLVFQITEPTPIDAGLVLTPATCGGACDGAATSSASGGTPGYTYVWSPQPGAGQGTPAASQLCPGDYTLTISDAAGCDTVIAFTIADPQPIVPTLTTTLASCGGACDGSAGVVFSGGSGSITIVWNPQPGSGQGTANAGGMCPGPWSVTLVDSLGCDTTLTFVIATPSGIVAVPTITDASCADVCDGTIVLAVSGGVPGYTYNWMPVPPVGSGANVGGLCPGQWIVQITDQAQCDTTLIMDVGSPSAILPNGVFTNETCNGPCDGTANVNPSGGAGGYVFTWSPTPPVGDGTANVSGLCAGNWSVTITDAGGCDTTWTFTVLPEQPILPNLTVTDVTCPGQCNGTASAAPTGGSGTFTYLWSPPPPVGQGTASVSGLCLGQWSVTITDINGCDTTAFFFVNKPMPLSSGLAVNNADCTGPCTGEAGAYPFGGTPGYTYLWQPPPGSGQGTFFASGLCAGTTYDLTVTDSLGCDTTETFTILDFVPITATITSTPVTCAGLCDGSATLGPSGGQAPYVFNWTPDAPVGDQSSTASGLCAGVYDVLIVDANNCDTTLSVLITGPAPIDPAPTVTPITCNGDCNGSISLAAQGGTGTLTYTWSPQPPAGQGTATISQLCAGTWTVTIGDVLGCDTTVSFTLTEPPVLAVQPEVVTSQCQACVGAITLHASGGGGGYFFAWGPPINITTPDSVQTGLCAGLYSVIIGDALGCVTQITVPVSDSNGETLTITDDNVTCPTDCDGQVSVNFNCSVPACTVAWFDALGTNLNVNTNTLNGLCAGIYLVQVTNGNGCIRIDSAQVFAPAPIVAQVSSTPVSCSGSCDGTASVGISGGLPPYQIVWSPAPPVGQGTTNVSGLCAGPYDITITDANGCSIVANVLILGPTPIDANATVQNVTCSGQCDGSIVLNAQGGAGAFQYSWNPPPPNGPGTSSATQLCPGIYGVTITDANGCDTTLSFTITQPQPLALTPSATPSHCQLCDGTGTVQVSGGTGAAVITWTDQNGANVGAGNSLSGLCAGIYTVTAQDANGCSAQTVVVITDANGEVLTVIDGQTTCANNCDGSVSVTFSCTVGPCEIEWFDANGQSIAQNQFTLNNLCIGDYYVEVVNGAGCTVIDTATVSPSQQIVPNLSTTPVTCNGACDGTATVGPTGGGSPYTYDWAPDPVTGDGGPSVTGLCAGVYTVLITGSTGCDTTINVLILEPPAIDVTAQVANGSCNTACDGSISLLTTGGTGSIAYSWSPVPPVGQGTADVSQLCAGDWSVTVSDANGCDTTITFTLTEPLPLTLATTSTLSTCGVCSGTTNVIASGGTPGYFYSWTQSGSVFGTDSTLIDICAGLYQVTVTDANGCQTVQSVPVSDVDGEALTASSDIVTCPGSCDGEVMATFNCVTPACTVTWFDALGNDLGESSSTLDSLCAGTYFVQVVNGTGCLTLDTAIVTDPQPIVPNLGTTQPTCAGACNGTATVGPTGGVLPYTYDWSPDPITGDGTASVTGLCAGTYSVLIGDSVGCSVLVNVLIVDPLPVTALATITPITCNGACDAMIVLAASGGTGQLTYVWTPAPGTGQGTDTVTALCADDWSVLISDANGCDTTYTYAITDPPVLQVSVSTIDNICFGDCSASANASITGGTAPYAVVWTTAGGSFIAQGDTTVSGLCAGDYIVQVTDTNGCQLPTPFTIGEGAAIQPLLTFTGETCNGPCDGIASVQPSGGAGGFTIAWTDPNGNAFAGDTTNISGLCAGDWSVTITDSLGCDSTFTFTLLPYTTIDPGAQVTPILCNGTCDGVITLAPTGGIGVFTFSWNPVPPNGDGTNTGSGLCPGDWSVTIADAVNCDTTITITVTEPPAISVVIDQVINASCNTASDGSISTTIGGGTPNLTITWTGPNSFTANTDSIGGLVPGSYTVTVQDANDCTEQQVVVVGALSTVLAAAGPDISQCSGAGLILNGAASQGASGYAWTDLQGALLGSQPLLDLGAPQPGAYTYILTVSDGPCTDDDTVFVNILPLPLADAGPDQSIFFQGSATLGGQPSGPPGSAFIWSPDSLVSAANAANPVASPSSTTWFTLTVTTSNGCSSLDSVLIIVVPAVVIPSGFSPNGDGSNDVWQIDYINDFPDCTVEVYNRWGELLFSSVGYPEPWDGTYNDGLVPVGTYYFAIELNDERFPEPITGPLTVIR